MPVSSEHGVGKRLLPLHDAASSPLVLDLARVAGRRVQSCSVRGLPVAHAAAAAAPHPRPEGLVGVVLARAGLGETGTA